MSIQIKQEQEFTTTRDYQGNPTAQTVQYLVHGAATEAEAFTALKGAAPTYISNLTLKGYELDEVKGGGAWTYDVNYEKSATGTPDSPVVQEPKYSCATGHTAVNMIRHFGEIWKSEGAESVPGTNLDEEGYKGVEVARANPTEGLSITVRRSKVTTAYKRKLIEMTFTVNKKKFKGWEPGEVLFTGAHISREGDEDYDISFEFAISLNEKDIDFMGITIPEKKGWDYAWATKKMTVTDNKKVLPVAKDVYVHKLYKESDFKQLGIGT